MFPDRRALSAGGGGRAGKDTHACPTGGGGRAGKESGQGAVKAALV